MNKIMYRVFGAAAALSIFFGLFSVVGASPALQTTGKTVYVSVAGSDLNNCAQSAPCKSFNKAMSLMQSGDTLHVMPGTYTQSLVVSKSGVTVEGSGAVIDGASPHGIHVPPAVSNVTVRGFSVQRINSHAIFVEGKSVTIAGNVVYHSVLENGSLSNGVVTCRNGAWGSAIKIGVGGENVNIRNNTVFGNCGEGIAATRGVNVVIDGNTSYDNHAANIYIDNSVNAQVLNNHVYCDKKSAMAIAIGEEYYSGWGAKLRDVVVRNNLIEGCSKAVMAFESEVNGTMTNVSIDGNIVPSGSGSGGVISLDNTKNSNVSVTNNQLYRLQFWVRSPSGVTLSNNTLYSGGATSTPTATAIPPTATHTSTPSVTNTAAAASPVPTSTPAESSPTATATAVVPSASPTAVFTATFTPTPTAIPPTPTHTSTPTSTPVPASPTPTSTPTPAEQDDPIDVSPSETIFDDTHGAFVYSDGWEDVRRKKAHGGSFKVTRQNNAFVTFTFTGTSFSVLYTGGPNFRSMDVYVDDVLVGTINQRIDTRTLQKRWDYSGQLEPGEHTLKLVFVSPKSRGSGSLDAVIVR